VIDYPIRSGEAGSIEETLSCQYQPLVGDSRLYGGFRVYEPTERIGAACTASVPYRATGVKRQQLHSSSRLKDGIRGWTNATCHGTNKAHDGSNT
jgi:hypothetical protein